MAEEVPSSLLIAASFSTSCILLLLGHILRIHLFLLRRLYLPASLIGGLLGLVIVQVMSIDNTLQEKLHSGVSDTITAVRRFANLPLSNPPARCSLPHNKFSHPPSLPLHVTCRMARRLG